MHYCSSSLQRSRRWGNGETFKERLCGIWEYRIKRDLINAFYCCFISKERDCSKITVYTSQFQNWYTWWRVTFSAHFESISFPLIILCSCVYVKRCSFQDYKYLGMWIYICLYSCFWSVFKMINVVFLFVCFCLIFFLFFFFFCQELLLPFLLLHMFPHT